MKIHPLYHNGYTDNAVSGSTQHLPELIMLCVRMRATVPNVPPVLTFPQPVIQHLDEGWKFWEALGRFGTLFTSLENVILFFSLTNAMLFM